jgi:hypothetical protein
MFEMRELITCNCECRAGTHKKCSYCGAHMPSGIQTCQAPDCEMVGAELQDLKKTVKINK